MLTKFSVWDIFNLQSEVKLPSRQRCPYRVQADNHPLFLERRDEEEAAQRHTGAHSG
jgi:hypothetical protein